MSKIDRIILAALGAFLLFMVAMCSTMKDRDTADEEHDACEKFCSVRKTDVRVFDTGVCVCK